MIQEVFMRNENKYILSNKQYEDIKERLKDKLVTNEFSFSTICNIYFDNDSYDLMRQSIEKPFYKEKLRLRSYEIPTLDSQVFLEIKKKCNGVVYKRRVPIKLSEFYDYYENEKIPEVNNNQIMKEIDYCFKKYALKPKMFLAYEREAYSIKDNEDFRITFDKNLRNREYDLKLEKGDCGEKFLNNYYLMEVKKTNNLPLWFAQILSDIRVYPVSYSKAGNVYMEKICN